MIYKYPKTKNISFPLGGIGTGCIGLTGSGELVDWEIFNRPSKGSLNGYTHFAIKAVTKDKTVTRVLHGDTNESRMGHAGGFGYGPRTQTLAGFPHFKNVKFDATFPVAHLKFSDSDFPAQVSLTAFNPFIPHNADDSGLPAAFFEWEIKNTGDSDIDYTLSFSVQNPAPVSRNCKINGLGGLKFINAEKSEGEIGYFDLCAATDAEDFAAEEYWFRGEWGQIDAATVYWKNISQLDKLPTRHYGECGKNDHGTVAAYITVPKKASRRVRFVLAWNVPVQYNYWSPWKNEDGSDATWKNYYATKFKDSEATARYALSNFDELLKKTSDFKRAIEESTVPSFVTEAVSANLSVLKSPTVLRLEDGSLWGWEGCSENSGSCEGSCQHVWNYAYALAYLFPSLERSLRENTVKYALKPSGETAFRIPLPAGRPPYDFRACVDGQMGEVIKCYREWKMSGDTEWLKKHAGAIFSMLEFAWSESNKDKWDANCDGVMEGRQHHTLDMELFGPSSWLQGFYLLALNCAAKMADALNERERAEKYRALYSNGRAWTNENLFNGKYFTHSIDIKDKSVVDEFGAESYWNGESGEISYQIAGGCIIDQMLSDYHAALIGADGIFDDDKKETALESLWKYNYKPTMRSVANMWRNFALNDESGTVICSYPDGVSVPVIPIPYCEETMTGFEYALGALMIAEGKISEGESIVKAVRERYDGESRNPWNEIECGSNYARSMASFSLLPIYSGFKYDMTEGYIGFFPVKSGDSRFLFSIKNTWGTVSFKGKTISLSVLGEALRISAFGQSGKVRSVTADDRRIDFSQEANVIKFGDISIEKELVIELA